MSEQRPAPQQAASPASGAPAPDAPLAPRLLPPWLETLRHVPLSAHVVTLSVLMTAVFLMFLLIEPSPRWLALFGASVAALSMDGVLRAARREAFDLGADATPHLFLPALYTVGASALLEQNVQGYWAIPAALLAGLGFAAVALAEIASVREFDRAHGLGRLVATVATYVVAFALFSLAYDFDVSLRPAIAAVALVAALLAIELLREGEIDPVETLVFAAVTALVVAEVRWMLHFLPLDGYLAGLTLLLAFYFATGVLHSHVTRRLSAWVAAEYALVTALGVALVVGARAGGLA